MAAERDPPEPSPGCPVSEAGDGLTRLEWGRLRAEVRGVHCTGVLSYDAMERDCRRARSPFPTLAPGQPRHGPQDPQLSTYADGPVGEMLLMVRLFQQVHFS